MKKPLMVNTDTCVGCKTCVSLGCPPISWKKFEDSGAVERKRRSKNKKVLHLSTAASALAVPYVSSYAKPVQLSR